MKKTKSQKKFNLIAETDEEATLLRDFSKTAIYRGLVPHDVLISLIESWLKRAQPKHPLSFQGEMLKALHESGLSTTQGVLLKHRLQNHLRKNPKKPNKRDGSDRLWRENKLGNIVYLTDDVIKHFSARKGKGSGGWLTRNGTSESSR